MVTISPMEPDEDVIMLDREDALDSVLEVPKIKSPPAGKNKSVLPLPATPFAGPYRSTFALKIAETTPEELNCLKHVNCSYLSTNGLPPTLLQLKQHAHSLTVLIKHMTVSTASAVVNNKNIQDGSNTEFLANESFDWLNDLTKAYDNNDRHHLMPLTSLLNTISPTPTKDSDEYLNMCPLHRANVRSPRNGISLPYATHETLIRHANEILELLDHEFSAKGGLLSILPPQDQKEDRALAETTLLGQLILYTSRLVQRVHDLERQYANALEVIKGEAVVPHQALSLLGPHGRKPREMVYPQDRFVLVNAGDDVWQYINNEFQRKEIIDKEEDIKAREQGMMGDALWNDGEGGDFARGITTLDITTRYYRLRNDPLETIFVIPAYQEHPGTKVIREMESQPTVVSVVKPVWPERASMWEMRNRDEMAELKRLRSEHIMLQNKLELADEAVKGVFSDQQLKAQELKELKRNGNEDLKAAQEEIKRLEGILKDPAHVSQQKVVEANNEAIKAKNASLVLEQELNKKKAELDQELKKAEAVTRAREELKSKEEARLKRMEETMEQRHKEREKKLTAKDVEIARSASIINDKLNAVWQSQIIEQQILMEFLKRTKPTELQGTQKPSEEDRIKGTLAGKKIIADMLHGRTEKPAATTTKGGGGPDNTMDWDTTPKESGDTGEKHGSNKGNSPETNTSEGNHSESNNSENNIPESMTSDGSQAVEFIKLVEIIESALEPKPKSKLSQSVTMKGKTSEKETNKKENNIAENSEPLKVVVDLTDTSPKLKPKPSQNEIKKGKTSGKGTNKKENNAVKSSPSSHGIQFFNVDDLIPPFQNLKPKPKPSQNETAKGKTSGKENNNTEEAQKKEEEENNKATWTFKDLKNGPQEEDSGFDDDDNEDYEYEDDSGNKGKKEKENEEENNEEDQEDKGNEEKEGEKKKGKEGEEGDEDTEDTEDDESDESDADELAQ